MRISRPSTRPFTPSPVTGSNCSTAGKAIPRARASRTIARARGCSLSRSSAATHLKSSFSSMPGSASMCISDGLPSVNVPVLSTTRVSILVSASMASAFRNRIPMPAPIPVATMIDMGEARPTARGHAMMSTATALNSAFAMRGSDPHSAHTRNVISAAATTAGTK